MFLVITRFMRKGSKKIHFFVQSKGRVSAGLFGHAPRDSRASPWSLRKRTTNVNADHTGRHTLSPPARPRFRTSGRSSPPAPASDFGCEWHGMKPDFLDRAGMVAPRRPFCGVDLSPVHMRSRCLVLSHLKGGRVSLSPGILPHPFPDGLESHPCQFGLNPVPFGVSS